MMKFKPVDNIHEVQIHLACDPDLIAVASNEYDRQQLRGIPEDRTGVLVCLPLGGIYCMSREDYMAFKSEEENELNRIQKHKGQDVAQPVHV